MDILLLLLTGLLIAIILTWLFSPLKSKPYKPDKKLFSDDEPIFSDKMFKKDKPFLTGEIIHTSKDGKKTKLVDIEVKWK